MPSDSLAEDLLQLSLEQNSLFFGPDDGNEPTFNFDDFVTKKQLPADDSVVEELEDMEEESMEM